MNIAVNHGPQEVRRLLIVGGTGGTNVGASFHRAALEMGLQSHLVDSARAYDAAAIVRFAAWHLLDKRPARLRAFASEFLELFLHVQPQLVLTTGLAPLPLDVLARVGQAGARRVNFLTDDPWNPAHRSSWFMKALPEYDAVYSPRRAMIPDLIGMGCANVRYLPFAYDPDIFYPATSAESAPGGAAPPDVVFAGGADEDRVPYLRALVDDGLSVALYGDYWARQPGLATIAKGQADPPTLRRALSAAKVGLCLVRRANRDGNCMRTFEVPAVGTCMLVEDTQEHRHIFGAEGECVLYFTSIKEMVLKCRRLCTDDALRERLAASAHRLITQGGHTYRHRLASMLADRERGNEHA